MLSFITKEKQTNQKGCAEVAGKCQAPVQSGCLSFRKETRALAFFFFSFFCPTPTSMLCNQIAMSTLELTPPQMNEQEKKKKTTLHPTFLITSPAANIDVVVPPTSLRYQRVCALIT